MQPRGEHNPRDLAQYVFKLPIPAFDPGCAAHQELVELAAQAEYVVAAVDLPAVKFEAQRRQIRRVLAESGVEGRIDAIVSALLEQAVFPDDHRRLLKLPVTVTGSGQGRRLFQARREAHNPRF